MRRTKKGRAESKTKVTPERSAVMRAVKSTNTKPEQRVRGLLRDLGVRHNRKPSKLPGSPDFAFASLKRVLFVHGCFWHGHHCARGARVPKINRSYWIGKIARNVVRDRKVASELQSRGWKIMIVWECELRDEAKVKRRLRRFLPRPHTLLPDLPYLDAVASTLSEWTNAEDAKAYDKL